MEKQFDVNSISNSTVIETKTDELLGQIIKIEYIYNRNENFKYNNKEELYV